MPSPILGMGAGAGKGLEELLHRLFLESEQARQSDQFNRTATEHERSNKAEEAYKGKALEESGKMRQLSLDALIQNRKDVNTDRDATRTLNTIKMRPIGSAVTPEEQQRELQAGATSGNYGWTPPTMGRSTAEGELGPEPERISWKGTPEQIAAEERIHKEPGPVSTQKKTVTYKGQPVDADYNPKTQTLTYKGEDITQEVGHYTAPDRVIMPTAEGLTPRGTVAARAASGNPMQPQATSATRTMEEGAKMLTPHIQETRAMATELDKAGLFGPAMSRLRQASEKAGSWDELAGALATSGLTQDRTIGKFATTLSLLASGAGRVHGGARGGGSPQMYAQFKAALSDSSTLPMFLGRLDALESFMSGYAAGPGGDGAAPTAADPYEEFLKRRGAKGNQK